MGEVERAIQHEMKPSTQYVGLKTSTAHVLVLYITNVVYADLSIHKLRTEMGVAIV